MFFLFKVISVLPIVDPAKKLIPKIKPTGIFADSKYKNSPCFFYLNFEFQ